ncbi:MAG: hypothetical protein GC161_09435 [Planctomycetaceae bacterium]|nr:hypothetical protein [Planctomycetaceae bacterium]
MPKTFPALLLLLVAVSATSILVDRWIRAPRPQPADPVATTAPATVEPNRDELATEGASDESARGPTTPALHPQDRAGAAAVAAASASTQAAVAGKSDVVRLRGRFLDVHGAGLGGTTITARGAWGRKWQLQDVADADGRFDLALPDERVSGIVLQAFRAGYVDSEWRFDAPSPAANFDVGDLLLAPGAAVTGRLAYEDGRDPCAGWLLRVRSPHTTRDGGAGSAIRVDPIDIAADGSFVLDGMPAGRTSFWAEYGSLARTEEVRVDLVAGETTALQLEHLGPDPGRQLDLHLFVGSQPADAIFQEGGLSLPPRSLRLEGPATVDLVNERGFFDRDLFDDMEPGPYTLVLDDPRFEPIRLQGVRPGHPRRLELRGRGALLLHVRDENQRPISNASVIVSVEGAPAEPPEYLQVLRAEIPDDGRIAGLLPVPLRVEVGMPGYEPSTVLVDPLEPGEERSLHVELSSRSRLAVHVVGDGVPAGDVTVVVAPTPETRDAPRFGRRQQAVEGTTDAEGRFEYLGLFPGDYYVYAWDSLGRSAHSGPFAVDVDAKLETELDLGASAHLEVRVVGPGEGALANYRLQASRRDLAASAFLENHRDPSPLYFRLAGKPKLATAEGNRYFLGPVSTGTYDLQLVVSGSDGPHLGSVILESHASGSFVFDLTDNFPGSAAVTIAVDGQPAEGTLVQLVRFEPRQAVEAKTDAEGVARFGGLAPGQWWPLVTSTTTGGGWSVPLDSAIEVVAAELSEAEFELETSPGVLRLVDGAGTPIQNLRCLIAPSAEWDEPRRITFFQGHRTDERGEFDLTLPHGEYVLFTGPLDHPAIDGDRLGGQRVTWPPATTPLVLDVDPQ